MPTTTLTTKGQLTLPKEIREALGLREGDRLDVAVEDGHVVMYPRIKRLQDLRGILPRPPRPISVEELNEGISQAAAAAATDKGRRS
ncbi:MAG TPA: AbrB/MazE/SpoVT family DNA-binding domain-containing protein [Candidatus Aquilonibacter sp.]|nr:AbrB/MazE/SpoVT family DNA-binding domain-containing protein [Candidatus Aquilonibacter sp.]